MRRARVFAWRRVSVALLAAVIVATLAPAPTAASSASGYELLVSLRSDRSAAVLLDGATLDEPAFVFVDPDTGLKRVRFHLDGVLQKTDTKAPWDFQGGSTTTANAFDFGALVPGAHQLTAELILSNGSKETASAGFTVPQPSQQRAVVLTPASLTLTSTGGPMTSGPVEVRLSDGSSAPVVASSNQPWLSTTLSAPSAPTTLTVSVDGNGLALGSHTGSVTIAATGASSATLPVTFNITTAGSPALVVSASPSRSAPVALAGQELGGVQYIFVSPDSGISQVDFFLDNPAMTGTPYQVELLAPFDLAGTASNGDANGLNTGSLTAGTHQVTARVKRTDGTTQVLNGSFTVASGSTCGLVPCSSIKVALPYSLGFDADRGGIRDGAGVGTGFTYLDPPASGNGYQPSLLAVDRAAGALRITTTSGLAVRSLNNQVNALGVGFDAPGGLTRIRTTVVSPPAGTGNFEQGGLWFGTDQDHYVKLVVLSTTAGPKVEFVYEAGGVYAGQFQTSVTSLTGKRVVLQLEANPVDRKVTASYSIDGGATVVVGSLVVAGELFSFDAAGIDPKIGTRSFTGVFASHRLGPSPLTYVFDDFSLQQSEPPVDHPVAFVRRSSAVPNPTSMAFGPDGRLYVTELFGKVHALSFDKDWNVVGDEVITALGSRLTLGIAVDPQSTATNVILWAAHSNPSVNAGAINSGIVSRISGPAWTRQDVITGLPRAYANHATNSIRFGPDGRLYLAQGGNTGAGAANTANTEFADRAEQPLSAAMLVADVRNTSLDFSCANTANYTGPPACNGVQVYASGLRNAYDFVFHSNGRMYAPDNGLGVAGSFPPSPTPPCTGMGSVTSWTQGGQNPGPQPDRLFVIEPGAYYGHPNPSRAECVFWDGSYQGVAPLPNFRREILVLGNNLSSNGIVEYTSDAFCGALKGNLLIANYSVGDNILRVRLSADGLRTEAVESIAGGFGDPLPLVAGPRGVVFVGEFGSGKVTALVPQDTGCWSTGPNLPAAVLDAGGAALDGRLYVVAGKVSSGHVSTMWVFNAATGNWSAGPNLPGVAVENPAVVAHAGKLWVFGGSTGPFSGAVSNAAVFDPATGTWTARAPMPTARGGASAQVVDGKIWVVGGMGADGASVVTVEIYDPVTNTWAAGQSMTTRRDNPGTAVLDGRLYVFGGRTREASGTTTNGTLASVEMFDPATGIWTARASMPTGRRTMVVGILGGRAQVIGGEIGPSGSSFADNQEYDPVTNTWRILQPIPTPRHGAAAGTINGAIHVVGGGPTGGTSFTPAHEIFRLPTANG